MKIIVEKKSKKKKKIAIVKNNIAIRIAGEVSRYIDASMNRATPSHNHGLRISRPKLNYNPDPNTDVYVGYVLFMGLINHKIGEQVSNLKNTATVQVLV